MFNRPGGGLFARRRLVAVADAWLVRRVEEFDLSQAVGVGGLTAAAGIAIRSASCQQPRHVLKQCENLVAPLSGGAALEEAAAWEAKQMEAARHAKELLLAEVERLSAARAKSKKGKKKKKNVDVGDTGAARLNEEMLCS
ncbi:hypothetical protein EMIHUDRAFT_214855 [Emiliania huxleyi CCMP1516]|uniref:Uncharacterized protein n=2 Tax=Emiliania huxleyi TaxID=2903 RepID=A0A0D3III5_EMIH1|nr:hypothetical protein EMIHUDRAFT_214855 [Emiliania huxleyi CCMP1516]EOD11070.1 hypothetical protein EMIHUDRAFT_214855 [Emiliania huxleyi CCMP1516]|eukprot:XP_005763499.1 hypothetical protein EMIHUDRAFT_214855 [Emiliania huxleyi CCMP1516]